MTAGQDPAHSSSLVSHRVRVGAAELECAWFALDEHRRPTIVFLHEGLGSIALWRDFPERLCAAVGCHGLIYSREGYGNSSPLGAARTKDFMHREAREVLPAVLASFELEHPILLGHSDGGSIALIHAASFPDTARAVIVLAPHIFVEESGLRSIEAAREAYVSGELAAKLKRYHADVDGAFLGWSDIWLDRSFRSWNLEDLLASIQCPLLAIQGHGDRYGTMAQIEGIKAHAPQARLVKLPDCGHSPHLEQPGQTLGAVKQFLEDVGATR